MPNALLAAENRILPALVTPLLPDGRLDEKSAERLIDDWRPQTLEELREEDLDAVFALQPEIVVLGSGSRQRFPETQLLAAILARGIGCEVMDTGAACRTYNVLVSESRRAVAALFV